MGMEYERKFAANPTQLDAVRKELGGAWFEYRMRTTYYDTADGALSGRKWMLRQRLENDAHVCTLKTPMGQARGEWETVSEKIDEAIGELCKLGAPSELLALTAGGVMPVCGAEFTRLAAEVEADGSVLEVALDLGRLFAGERETPLCEIEVELKAGETAAADRFAGALAARFGLNELTDSKFKRARALIG